MSSPRRSHLLVVLLLGLLAFLALSGPALAADLDEIDPDDLEASEIALRLSPAVLEVPHEAGSSHHELRVDNLGTRPVQVITQLDEFTVTEDGITQFLGPEDASATSWASLDVESFELAPSDRRDVVLTVDVPDDAEPGERYLSVIFVVPGDEDGDGNISVTHRVAVKLFIEVPGQRIEHLELGELDGPRLIDAGPAAFELTVHNHGNVHRRFEEDGRLLATRDNTSFPFENFTVLGDSTRVVEATWTDPPLLCWCTVDVEIDDGRGNLLTASTQVIAFPLRFSLALLVLTVGLAFVAVGRRRGRTARLERKLQNARGQDAHPTPDVPAPPADTRPPSGPRSLSPPVPPARHDVPVAQPAQLVTTVPSSPFADAAAVTGTEASPSAPQEPAPAPAPRQLDTRMFTAHALPDQPQRRRRRRN